MKLKNKFVLMVTFLEDVSEETFLVFNTKKEMDKFYKEELKQANHAGMVEVLEVKNPEELEKLGKLVKA